MEKISTDGEIRGPALAIWHSGNSQDLFFAGEIRLTWNGTAMRLASRSAHPCRAGRRRRDRRARRWRDDCAGLNHSIRAAMPPPCSPPIARIRMGRAGPTSPMVLLPVSASITPGSRPRAWETTRSSSPSSTRPAARPQVSPAICGSLPRADQSKSDTSTMPRACSGARPPRRRCI